MWQWDVTNQTFLKVGRWYWAIDSYVGSSTARVVNGRGLTKIEIRYSIWALSYFNLYTSDMADTVLRYHQYNSQFPGCMYYLTLLPCEQLIKNDFELIMSSVSSEDSTWTTYIQRQQYQLNGTWICRFNCFWDRCDQSTYYVFSIIISDSTDDRASFIWIPSNSLYICYP